MLRACVRAAHATRSDAVARVVARQCRRGLAVPSDFNLLEDEQGSVRIDGYDASGFLVSGVQYPGAVLTYLNVTLAWRVAAFEDVTPDACVRAQREVWRGRG